MLENINNVLLDRVNVQSEQIRHLHVDNIKLRNEETKLKNTISELNDTINKLNDEISLSKLKENGTSIAIQHLMTDRKKLNEELESCQTMWKMLTKIASEKKI